MSELKPTPTRLALLRSIERGEVTGYPSSDGALIEYYLGRFTWAGQKVTKRVEEAFRATWAERGGDLYEGFHPPFTVVLTHEGERVLAEHSGGEK